jgi:hypothetical protein
LGEIVSVRSGCAWNIRNLISIRRETPVAHEYAIRLALVAFATATAHGIGKGSGFEPALKYALAAAGIFYIVGWLCGEIAQRIITESVQAEFASELVNPPENPAAGTASSKN